MKAPPPGKWGTRQGRYWRGGPKVPHAAAAIYSVYDTQDAAVLALRDGEVDFMLNPLGLQRGLQSTVIEAGDLDVISNSPNGFRYVAFNTRRFPGSEPSSGRPSPASSTRSSWPGTFSRVWRHRSTP